MPENALSERDAIGAEAAKVAVDQHENLGCEINGEAAPKLEPRKALARSSGWPKVRAKSDPGRPAEVNAVVQP